MKVKPYEYGSLRIVVLCGARMLEEVTEEREFQLDFKSQFTRRRR